MAGPEAARGVRVLVAAAPPHTEEAEFFFPGARYSIESGGALRVFGPLGDDAGELMALGPGAWRAAWHVDETGQPLGLNAPDRLAAPGLPPPARPSSERSARVLELLGQGVFQGLDALASRAGEPVVEVERILAAALSSKTLEPERVALPTIQRELDAALPELLASDAPKSPKVLLAALRERPATQACDAIQLRVWIMRNPQKRPA
jgi:hypothetical protein